MSFFFITKHTLQNIRKKIIPKEIQMRSLQFFYSYFDHFVMFFNYKIHEACLSLYIISKIRHTGNPLMILLIWSFCVYVHMYMYVYIWSVPQYLCRSQKITSGIGLWVFVLGYWFLSIGPWGLVFGHSSLGIGIWVLARGYLSLGVGPRVLVLLVVRYWSSAVGLLFVPCLIQDYYLVFCYICFLN